ncbi:EamA family transporter [Maritimibacter sp. DP07]|uniref:EamA family transporter n=1 Tax=Maritimibacter harenae TaxID=2606218 RepID=A0A845M8J4_9RHOB|nr:DMT family transporter [Maritimibacter harenae]MZR13903.1 EamA family transporter [Maritimibacter harenae]
MRLFLATALTMVAFAANSILNRMALAAGSIDAVSFGAIRLASGAAILVLVVLVTRGRIRLAKTGRWVGVAALLTYIFGFSFGYVSIDAGLGTLILFGTVQITLFTAAIRGGEPVATTRKLGAAIALAGLALVLWPTEGLKVDLLAAACLVAAAVGWGFYTLNGRRSTDAIGATMTSFVIGAPVGIALALALPLFGQPALITPYGIGLAILSGAVTSGLGYSIWYAVLPHLATTTAAIAQLAVPILAMAGGIAFLGEPLTPLYVVATVLVIGGVALSLRR